MATRTEKRFGEVSSLDTTYTAIGTVPAGSIWNILLNVTNRTASSTVKLRAYVAGTGWTTGEPTGGTLKAAIAYDTIITPGDVTQITGIVMNAGERIVVRSDTASSLDVIAAGVEVV